MSFSSHTHTHTQCCCLFPAPVGKALLAGRSVLLPPTKTVLMSHFCMLFFKLYIYIYLICLFPSKKCLQTSAKMSVCGPKAAHHIYETVHCCCFLEVSLSFFFLEIRNVFLHMLLCFSMKGRWRVSQTKHFFFTWVYSSSLICLHRFIWPSRKQSSGLLQMWPRGHPVYVTHRLWAK